jgi:hypothetical protein
MPKMTPEQEATYALGYGTARSDLSRAAQIEYDRLITEGPLQVPVNPSDVDPLAGFTRRTDPETRARILAMFKKGNSKYAKPFDKDRLAWVSVFGGNWEEYGQVVLQMAMLDTLLSIEEKLARLTSEET